MSEHAIKLQCGSKGIFLLDLVFTTLQRGGLFWFSWKAKLQQLARITSAAAPFNVQMSCVCVLGAADGEPGKTLCSKVVQSLRIAS